MNFYQWDEHVKRAEGEEGSALEKVISSQIRLHLVVARGIVARQLKLSGRELTLFLETGDLLPITAETETNHDTNLPIADLTKFNPT